VNVSNATKGHMHQSMDRPGSFPLSNKKIRDVIDYIIILGANYKRLLGVLVTAVRMILQLMIV
jgi:hypothetical protein